MAFNFVAASTQYLSVGSAPVATFPYSMAATFYVDDVTAAYWICFQGLSTATSGQFAGMITRGDVAGDPLEALTSQLGAAGSAQSGNSLTSAVWQSGQVIFESTVSRSVRLNNDNIQTNTASVLQPSVDRFSIGAGVRQTVSGPLNGRAAEVAIWNVALTDAEMSTLAKGFKPTRVRPQSLVFYAPLVRDLQDLRGALTITNNNTATVADHPRVY